jgi:PhnB protein
MTPDLKTNAPLQTSLAPWLSVRNGAKAVAFYKAAFGATEVYRMEDPGSGLVVRLSVDGPEFWVSGESLDDASSAEEIQS